MRKFQFALPLVLLLFSSGVTTLADDADDLQQALSGGNIPRIKSILAENPKLINQPDDECEVTVLFTAVNRGYGDLVRWLLAHGAHAKPLHKAVMLNDGAAVRRMILADRKAVNLRDDEGYAPLHYAAALGYRSMARDLLHTGAIVDMRTPKDGCPDSDVVWGWETPLHLAARNGHNEVVCLLLNARAKVNAKEISQDATPLHWAALHNHVETARLLIARGANVNAAGTENEVLFTPLHQAAQSRSYEVAKLLIEHGAKVNARSKGGPTPLACAGNSKVADLIKKHGGKLR